MKRFPRNPILTRADLPDVPPRLVDPTSVFNPGAIAWDGGVALLLRVQTRGRRTLLLVATSPDGERFRVRPRIVAIEGLADAGEEVFHVYDPRLTRLGDDVFVVFAADVPGACRLGIARTRDLERFELVSFDRSGDRRNGVLFPDRVQGRFARLERPNRAARPGDPASGEEIVLSLSEDLVSWREAGVVMRGRARYWDERIGSGPPPIRVEEGWLHVYHGVATHFQSVNVYQAGVVLLDAEEPRKVLARTRDNVLEPRESWEMVGQVPNVVFPSGLVVPGLTPGEVAPRDARVLVYYGAADTCVGLAVTTVGELLDACGDDAG